MSKGIVNILLLLSPALCIFGPLFIVVGYDPLNHAWADIGALMTGIGSLILYLKIMSQSRQIEAISRQPGAGDKEASSKRK
jgi:energy-converting hydrogenase Eha subunit C